MATVNKDFKIKSGLIVEGTTASVNGFDILTKKQADQDYIVGLIGGTATSANEANKVVKRDANGNFAAGTITAALTGNVTGTVSSLSNHDTADLAEGTNLYFTNARAISATAASYDVLGAAAAAQSAAIAHADALTTSDVAEGTALYFTDERAQDAIGTNLGSGLSYNDTTGAISVDTSVIANKSYVDTSVANLVDGAPALLDTLNELAAAIGDDANFATTLTTSVGTKVSKAGDTMTGLLVLSADPSANLGAATKQYVDQAETDAIATAASDATSKANTAEQNAKNYADALTTSDVAEGTAQYFTDARAKSSAASLLTGATLTNITITGSGSGLTITAENGVADSNTDQLAEGTTNKYFTDARARAAVDGTDRSFTSVDLNSVAKQVAATLSAPTAGIQTAHAFAKADYRSAEYLVKVAYGTHTEISKVLLTLDTSDNIAITEYGIVGTNGSASTISAGISGANVQLQVTTTNNNSTVTVMGTLLK
jgi:hypothetical protein